MRFFTAKMEKLHDPSQDTGSARLHLCAKKINELCFQLSGIAKKGEKTSKKKMKE